MINKKALYPVVFVLLFITADSAIGYFSDKVLHNTTSGFYGMINKSINDTSDIFVLGSSRAECHYDSEVLNNLTGRTVFNAGAGGYSNFYSFAILKERLKRKKPELVIYDIAPTRMMDTGQFELLAGLNPVTGIYSAFNDIAKINPEYRQLRMLLCSYRYNSSFYDIFKNTMAQPDSNDAFMPLEGELDINRELYYYNPATLTKKEHEESLKMFRLQLKYLDSIGKLCKKNKVKLAWVISPSYTNIDKYGIMRPTIQKFMNRAGYEYIDFTDNKKFAGHPKLFKDQQHLNTAGAKYFTKVYINTINRHLKTNIIN